MILKFILKLLLLNEPNSNYCTIGDASVNTHKPEYLSGSAGRRGLKIKGLQKHATPLATELLGASR